MENAAVKWDESRGAFFNTIAHAIKIWHLISQCGLLARVCNSPETHKKYKCNRKRLLNIEKVFKIMTNSPIKLAAISWESWNKRVNTAIEEAHVDGEECAIPNNA